MLLPFRMAGLGRELRAGLAALGIPRALQFGDSGALVQEGR